MKKNKTVFAQIQLRSKEMQTRNKMSFFRIVRTKKLLTKRKAHSCSRVPSTLWVTHFSKRQLKGRLPIDLGREARARNCSALAKCRGAEKFA